MNANSQSQTPTVKDWLNNATHKLTEVSIPSARLDAEIILANAIDQNRTYLHAHSDEDIDKNQLKTANNNLQSRLKRIPIAYILGYKEFYGRNFIVNKSTLIPRPESEEIINIVKKILPSTAYNLPPTSLIDVGTGSGCLGITLKLEFPTIDVALTDISPDALKIAKVNAKKLSVDVKIIQSDLLSNYEQKTDIIVANLPYVNPEWKRSPETNFEPDLALFADDNGMLLIKQLIDQASDILTTGGYLILESDPEQHELIIEYAKKYSFDLIYQIGYITAFKR
jgi:release factor glutamine methyltransferase